VLVNAVRLANLDLLEAGVFQRGAKLAFGQRSGDAARQRRHVRAGVIVDVGVGDHIGHGKPPARRRTRNASWMTRGLSPEGLITQLEITTSTVLSARGMSSR